MVKNFFNISDLTKDQLLSLTSYSDDKKVLKDKNIGLIFEKNSTRTRLSFAVGIQNLGGNAIDIRFEDLNIARQETFEDTFKAFNCYLDGIIYRTDSHQKLTNASKYFQKPIINALSELSHPCQIISDLYTLKEKFKTLNIHILWIGDMNNVCFSLVEAVNILNEIKLTICTPKEIKEKKNWNLSSNVAIFEEISKVDLSTVQCVMTDVFLSMNDEEVHHKVSLLEGYKVTLEIMQATANNSVFMHCLPAKIGNEVSEEVINGPRSIVWKQAHNRLLAQKKLLQLIDWN